MRKSEELQKRVMRRLRKSWSWCVWWCDKR